MEQERAEKALSYLVETDKEHARAKAEFKANEALTKTILAYEFREAEGSGELRKATSYSSETYQAHIKKIELLEIGLQTMYNRRDTARQIIEMYRTASANTRKGNI